MISHGIIAINLMKASHVEVVKGIKDLANQMEDLQAYMDLCSLHMPHVMNFQFSGGQQQCGGCRKLRRHAQNDCWFDLVAL